MWTAADGFAADAWVGGAHAGFGRLAARSYRHRSVKYRPISEVLRCGVGRPGSSPRCANYEDIRDRRRRRQQRSWRGRLWRDLSHILDRRFSRPRNEAAHRFPSPQPGRGPSLPRRGSICGGPGQWRAGIALWRLSAGLLRSICSRPGCQQHRSGVSGGLTSSLGVRFETRADGAVVGGLSCR